MEKAVEIFFLLLACVSIVAVVVICVFLFANGLPAVAEIGVVDFLFGKQWRPGENKFGIFPMIVGSVYATVGAILIGVPIGVLTAVFMAKICPKKLYKFLKPAVELLAGIPSIVYGFFALVVIVPIIRNTFPGNGLSLLSACILLGIMILPTIIGVAESAIRAVPESYYEGALALGATRERSLFKVVLPAAKSGVSAGVVLGISLLCILVGFLLENQMKHTAGLGGVGTRAILETVQTLLNGGRLLLLPFWQIGFLYASMNLVRRKPAEPRTLMEGFRRFLPFLRLQLIMGVIYALIVSAAGYAGAMVFVMTPFSDPLMNIDLSGVPEEEALNVLMAAFSKPDVMIPLMLIVGVIALVTAGIRFLPFGVFRGDKQTPPLIEKLGRVLPYAIMGMLVVYCLKGVSFGALSSWLPSAIACVVTVVLYGWKRNTLLSIIGGTVCYMLLVQMVF